MRFITIYCFFILTVTTNAQTIKLDYEPQGKIIKFYFDSLTICTDTTALFDIYTKDGTLKDYDSRVISFVRKEVYKTSNDTIIFIGNFIPFNDNIEQEYQKDWYVEWAILQLTKKSKLKILDKHGQAVIKIIRKKIGTKKKGYVRRAFINKETKEELFSELLFMRTVNPAF